MARRLSTPLEGKVHSGLTSNFSYRNKIIFGVCVLGLIPFALSTYAASVTVGTGALEFGQGSQQAVACDSTVYAAVSEEWHSSPKDNDASAGFFRVKSLTVSDLDLVGCKGKKLRVRLIDTNGNEISIGAAQEEKVLQIALPDTDAPESSSDVTFLQLTYLASDGTPISDQLNATVSVNTSGTSIYDGADMTPNNADVTFYLDQSANIVNIDGQNVGRVTVETVNNPNKR